MGVTEDSRAGPEGPGRIPAGTVRARALPCTEADVGPLWTLTGSPPRRHVDVMFRGLSPTASRSGPWT